KIGILEVADQTRSGKIRVAQVTGLTLDGEQRCSAQRGTGQIRALKEGNIEPATVEVRASQVRIVEHRGGKVRTLEVDSSEIETGQVLCIEIRRFGSGGRNDLQHLFAGQPLVSVPLVRRRGHGNDDREHCDEDATHESTWMVSTRQQ